MREAAVDGKAFDLVEDGRVGGIRRVAPVDAAERDHVDRRRLRLHDADLGRRGLGAKEHVAVQEDRLPRRASRVVGGQVERVEVVAGRLDLAAVDDLVAQPEEDVLDLTTDLRDQVQVAARSRCARERDVRDLLSQPAIELGSLQLRLAVGDRPLELLAKAVERRAGLARPEPRGEPASARSSGRGSGRARRRARRGSRRPQSRFVPRFPRPGHPPAERIIGSVSVPRLRLAPHAHRPEAGG